MSSDQKKEKGDKFWVNDPSILITNLQLVPCEKMTRDEKFNALTRLVIIFTIFLYFMDVEYWLTFLLVAVLVIVLLKFTSKDVNNAEHFTVTPTFASLDFQQTEVAPLFDSSYSIIPVNYDIVENIPPEIEYTTPLPPQSYVYGQYVTPTNLLPNDEQACRMLNGGVRQARAYANSAFTRQSLAFRENMTRLYKKKLARRYKNQLGDAFSSFTSF